MKFETRYPSHPELKRHIQYYYFVKTEHHNHYSRYFSFPNTTIPVNIHKNVGYEIADNKISVSGIDNFNYTTLVNGLRQGPLLVEWNGIIDKVTIAFTPAGLNHFINRNINEAVTGFTSSFTDWESNKYLGFLNKFYTTANLNKRVQLLEKFLLTIYRPFEKEKLLSYAVQMLTDFSHEMSIHEIASKINTSERTLNRLFGLHIGISPVAYRKIARFRQSLENKVVKEKFKRLTDIGYESNYYDQSYFIKMYKQLSGKNPKNLYDAVEKLADDNVILEFLENSIDFG